MKENLKRVKRCYERGTTAVEFAILFPVLFFLTYGTFIYGYTFFVQQSINLAAEEGARAALQAVSDPVLRCTLAQTAAANALIFLPQAAPAATCPAPPAPNTFSVNQTFPIGTSFPIIDLGFGPIPPLPPGGLTATATVAI